MKEDDTKIPVFTDRAPIPAGPYSQGIQIGDFLFLSGQRPVHPETNQIPESITDQTRQCMNNLKSVVEAAGATMADIIRTNVYLADIKYFYDMNEIYKEMIPQPYPARTTVGCQLRDILVEIDAIVKLKHNEEN